MYLILFLYALLASTFSIGKLLVQILPPIFLISIRMILAGIILLAVSYAFSGAIKIRKKDWWLFATVVLFHILIPFLTEYIALQYISPSTACLIYDASPFISALFSYIIFQELMTFKKWVGFLVGICGIILYLQSQCCIDFEFSWPNLCMFLSVVASCLGWVFVRLLVKNQGYSPLQVNGIAMFIAGWIALLISWYTQEVVTMSMEQLPHVAMLLATIIFIANILFYNLYGYLLTKYTATFLSFAGFVTPLFAAFFEWLFFGTVVPHQFFLTISIVGIGIFVFYQEELKQGYTL